MNNQIDATITGIYLGGFQVFDEVNFIPLRRLTFFYGPNSSGKSAVEDALQLIQKEFFWGYYLTSYRESFLISYNEEKYLNENWRRVSEESDSYAPECTLGFQFISNGHLIKSLEVCGLETLDRHPSKFANYALKKYEAEVAHIDQVLIDYSAKYQRINLKENCVTSKGRRERCAFQRVLSMSVNGMRILANVNTDSGRT